MDDPGTGNVVFDSILLLVLIFINAYLAMAETVITLLNDSKVENGGRRHKKQKEFCKSQKPNCVFISN